MPKTSDINLSGGKTGALAKRADITNGSLEIGKNIKNSVERHLSKHEQLLKGY
jgi:hypothetical protein